MQRWMLCLLVSLCGLLAMAFLAEELALSYLGLQDIDGCIPALGQRKAFCRRVHVIEMEVVG